jgi:hypothetical protein
MRFYEQYVYLQSATAPRSVIYIQQQNHVTFNNETKFEKQKSCSAFHIFNPLQWQPYSLQAQLIISMNSEHEKWWDFRIKIFKAKYHLS